MRDLAEYDEQTGITSIANHITYDAFGTVTSETNAAVNTIFGFTGRESDEESDLYYYRARYYDPHLGQFLSEDPLGFEAKDPNLRRYVGTGPVDALDPSGLEGYVFDREASAYVPASVRTVTPCSLADPVSLLQQQFEMMQRESSAFFHRLRLGGIYDLMDVPDSERDMSHGEYMLRVALPLAARQQQLLEQQQRLDAKANNHRSVMGATVSVLMPDDSLRDVNKLNLDPKIKDFYGSESADIVDHRSGTDLRPDWTVCRWFSGAQVWTSFSPDIAHHVRSVATARAAPPAAPVHRGSPAQR